MNDKLKRIGALLICLAMMVTMCLPVMGATKPLSVPPSADDTGTVSVSGLKAGDTVTFYQIVRAKYDATGFAGYEAVKDPNIVLFNPAGQPIYPNAQQIAALSKDSQILVGGISKTANGAGVVTADLKAGEWLAIVTPVDAVTIYNPLVVSVYYTNSGGTIESGELNVANGQTYNITGSDSYVKQTAVDVDKTITGNTMEDVQTSHGDDLAVGDSVTFKIESTIPAYSQEYENIVYTIKDEMDAGLDLAAGSVSVKIGGQVVSGSADTFTLTPSAHGFEVAFSEEYVRQFSDKTDEQRKVEITYSAALNGNATVNFDANDNKVTVTYTNSPEENAQAKTIEKETHQYTFAIDGNINGSQTTVNRRGHEIIKVNENGEPETIEWVNDGTDETTVTTGLAGAKFTLTQIKDSKGNNITNGKIYTATTDGNGYFDGFTGLDAGTYELVETEAPAGYSLNSQKHTVVISANYDESTGLLLDYSIKIDNTATSTYQATYSGTEVTQITTVGEPQTTFIKNTKLNALPSTGGNGTYLLTVFGVAVFALAMSMVFRDNRKFRQIK